MKITPPASALNKSLQNSPFPAKKTGTTPQANLDNTTLSQGRLIKGEILATNSNGTVTIALGGKSVTAQSLVPLTVGQEIWLEVIKEGDIPILGVASKKGAALNVMRQLLSLVSLGSQGDLSKIALENQPQLQQFTSLFHESLQDSNADPGKLLKTLSLLGLLNPDQKKRPSETSDPANKVLNSLVKIFESHAQLNSQPASRDQQNFLLCPCFFAGNSGWGEWMFKLDEHESSNPEEQKNYGLTFFLEMSNLGEVHIDIQKKADGLQGVFSLANKKSQNFLNENMWELTGILEKLGYTPVNISSKLSNTTNLHNLKDTLSLQTGTPSFALLDTTI